MLKAGNAEKESKPPRGGKQGSERRGSVTSPAIGNWIAGMDVEEGNDLLLQLRLPALKRQT